MFFSTNCQLKDANRPHGLNFLENREKTLIINKTNKNDVIKVLGNPHSTSIKNENTWIYIERTTKKGELHQLGRNILIKNNVLELEFNKYGILTKKILFDKDDMKKVKYSNKETVNEVSQIGVVGKFLSSIKQKMYGKKKF